ncbi:four helix bundle protein [Tamlana flava]|uniref:four helix bundle protein n=1 Tax=Tamlana flava TaxID=3158572 RepID=UPI00351BB784
MAYTFSFEKLNVWVDSKELVKSIYLTTKDFSSEEKFGLTNQLRRASISITSYLAEGSSRNTDKDKAHFSTVAFSSLMEVLNQIIIAHELGFLSEKDYQKIRTVIEKISNKLSALRKSQLNRQTIKQINDKTIQPSW